MFGIFAPVLAEFERELNRDRTRAGLTAARARERKGGRKFALSKAQVRLAQAAMAHRDTSVSALCRELKISPPPANNPTAVAPRRTSPPSSRIGYHSPDIRTMTIGVRRGGGRRWRQNARRVTR